jgi:endogenous inhibitor of DNA gyrase (YacG/DUF329 family)
VKENETRPCASCKEPVTVSASFSAYPVVCSDECSRELREAWKNHLEERDAST